MRPNTRRPGAGGRPHEEPQGWRRWIRIGPGVIVALVIAVALLVFRARMQAPPQGPPIVERQVQPSEHRGSYPEVRFLIDRRDRLNLTSAQVARLEAIQKEWDVRTAPDRRALDQASRQFDQYLSESQRKGRAPAPEIQQRAAEVSALSGALAQSRYDAWQKALKVLNQQQRARAEALRRAEARPWKAR